MLEINRPRFLDIKGKVRFIHQCSIDDLDKVHVLYQDFWLQIFSIDQTIEIDFKEACDRNPKVLEIAKTILRLSGIKTKWVDFPLMAALVHSYVDEEGNSHEGYLFQSYLMRKPKEVQPIESEQITWDEYKYQLFSALVDINGSTESAYAAYQNTPIDLIEKHLEIKAKQYEKQQKDPDGKLEKLKRHKKKYLNLTGKTETDLITSNGSKP